MATAFNRTQYETASTQRLESAKFEAQQTRALVYELGSLHERLSVMDDQLGKVAKDVTEIKRILINGHSRGGHA